MGIDIVLHTTYITIITTFHITFEKLYSFGDAMPKDPVCGMEVPETSEYRVEYRGKTYYFCCDHCVNAFKKNPGKYVK